MEREQRKVTEGWLADVRRRELIVHLHREQGMTQTEIAARLSRASMAAGGPPIGDDAVWKIVKAARTSH